MSVVVQQSRRRRPPSYRHHKPTGQAVVTLNGKDFYLGLYDTPASREAYDRKIAEWFASGRQIIAKANSGRSISVADLIAAFWLHAESYYVDRTGNQTSELVNYRYALRVVDRLYATQPAVEFGPLALRAVREEMIRKGWTRKSVNKQVNRIRHVFKWAASQELIPPSLVEGLRTLAGLQPGRGGAKEADPVKPVPDAHIEVVKPFVSRQVWALIQLQLLTGARAGELVTLRATDIDTSEDVWTSSPAQHKNAHRGHDRTIYFGPRGKEVIRPFLSDRPVNAFLFSPAEAEIERRAEAHAARKTPATFGNAPGTNQQAKPQRVAGEHYTVASYRRAIARACDIAFPPPEHLRPLIRPNGKQESRRLFRKRLTAKQKTELHEWQSAHRWHPHQLRHNAATYIRREFGVELAKVILGHRSLDVTALYAEADTEKAIEAIRRIG